jgi:transcriptional regulator with XRE-family HTH domain
MVLIPIIRYLPHKYALHLSQKLYSMSWTPHNFTLTIHNRGIIIACVANENLLRFGSVLKQQRLSIPLTLQELSGKARVSASHLGRIERGQRFPSAKILRRLAGPLGLEENEIFTVAGYLTPQSQSLTESKPIHANGALDPVVARMLSQETIEVQRQVISILNILKSLAKNGTDSKPGTEKK